MEGKDHDEGKQGARLAENSIAGAIFCLARDVAAGSHPAWSSRFVLTWAQHRELYTGPRKRVTGILVPTASGVTVTCYYVLLPR